MEARSLFRPSGYAVGAAVSVAARSLGAEGSPTTEPTNVSSIKQSRCARSLGCRSMGRTFSYRGGTQPSVENGQRRDSRLHSHHKMLLAQLFSMVFIIPGAQANRMVAFRHQAFLIE